MPLLRTAEVNYSLSSRERKAVIQPVKPNSHSTPAPAATAKTNMVKSQHESAKLLAETDAFLQITPNLALLMTVALAAAENTTHHCVGRETGRPYRCFTWEVMTETCIRWEGMEASPIPCDYPCSTEYCAQVFLPYRFFQQKKISKLSLSQINTPLRSGVHRGDLRVSGRQGRQRQQRENLFLD